MISSIFEQISDLGISGKYSLHQKRTIRLVNQTSLIGIFFCLLSVIVNVGLGYYESAIFSFVTGILFGVNIWFNHCKKYRRARIFLIGLGLVSTTVVNVLVDLHSMPFYYFLTTFVLGILFFPGKVERFYIFGAHVVCISFAIGLASQLDAPIIRAADPVIFGIINIVLVMVVLFVILNAITRENQRFEHRTVELLSSITDKNRQLKQAKERTEESAKALKVINANLKREVKERQKMEEALRVSNEALQQFAFVASHDLKEPLRTIMSFTKLLQRRLGSDMDKTSGEYFHFIVDGARRMVILLDDLLTYSRLNTEIKFDEMNLNNTVEIIQYNLKNLLDRRNAAIIYSNLPTFTANRSQLAQVFQNMITNGLKFNTDKNPKVEIACEETIDEYIFSVRDNGIGIPPEYQDKIFMIFQRLHNRETYEGTGIGLAICKKVIDNHKGRLWLHSTPNVGTTFFFTIPKNLLGASPGMKGLKVMDAEMIKQN